MNVEIPLDAGAVNAHQKFTAQLGDNFIEFSLNFLQTGQWSVDLFREGVPIAIGVMLEPNADIIAHHQLGIGQLIFIGANTTLANLGTDNHLIWVPPDE